MFSNDYRLNLKNEIIKLSEVFKNQDGYAIDIEIVDCYVMSSLFCFVGVRRRIGLVPSKIFLD